MSRRKPTAVPHTDVILPMTDDYMQQIVRKEKTFEFRRYMIASSVKRVWFYLNAPNSHIRYICSIDAARTRLAGDEPLPEDGAGNREFNERHKDWDKYDFAYRILDVREISPPIILQDMKSVYGMKGAPRGLVYVPTVLRQQIKVHEQTLLWVVNDTIIDNASGEKRKAQSALDWDDAVSPKDAKKARHNDAPKDKMGDEDGSSLVEVDV